MTGENTKASERRPPKGPVFENLDSASPEELALRLDRLARGPAVRAAVRATLLSAFRLSPRFVDAAESRKKSGAASGAPVEKAARQPTEKDVIALIASRALDGPAPLANVLADAIRKLKALGTDAGGGGGDGAELKHALSRLHRLLGIPIVDETPVFPKKLGWALSGGGARGAFEAGAIRFLAANLGPPPIVAGTSVGAVNALGVAMFKQSVGDALPAMWLLRLWQPDQMFVESQGAKALDSILNAVGTSIAAIVTGHGPAVSLPPANSLNQLLIEGVVLEELTNLDRVYSLEPTRKLLNEVLADGFFPDIRMRLVMVSLADGKPYYVDENAMAHEMTFTQPRVDDGGPFFVVGDNRTDRLIRAAVASASMPIIFGSEGLVLSANSNVQTLWDVLTHGTKGVEAHQMVDGGVRDVLPVRAAIEAGAQAVIAISASARLFDEAPAFGWGAFFNSALLGKCPPLLSQIPRTIQVLVNEASEDDRFEGGAVGLNIIEPLQDVLGVTEVDPGLIRIAIDYGYMRAHDALSAPPPGIKVGSLTWLLWCLAVLINCEEIVRLRKEAHGLEQNMRDEIKNQGAVSSSTMHNIRTHKRDIFAALHDRVCNLWGGDPDCVIKSLPGGFDVSDAWLTFERHVPQLGYAPTIGGPFTPRIVRDSSGALVHESAADVGVVPATTITCPTPP